MLAFKKYFGGAVAQLGARLDGIEEVVGSNPIGSTNLLNHLRLCSSIKAEVKKKISPAAGIFLTSQPM